VVLDQQCGPHHLLQLVEEIGSSRTPAPGEEALYNWIGSVLDANNGFRQRLF